MVKSTEPIQSVEEEEDDFSPYRDEIVLILTLLLSVFSLLSIIGVGGIIGKWFRMFIFGMMGLPGYLFPFVLFFGTVFILSNYQNRKILYKILCCIGIYFVSMGLLQLLFYANSDSSLLKMYFQCAGSTLGGGLIGALLTMPLSSIIGVAGTYVLWFAVLLILITFITSRFFLTALENKGEKELRRIQQQYEAEHAERTIIRESYRELPPRKRKPSITFDLTEDTTAVPIIEETLPIVNPIVPPKQEEKKKKKQVKKEPEMKEYEPSVEEEEPIAKGSSEIREELEQSLFAEDFPKQEYIPGRPSVRFIDSSQKSNYRRKMISPDKGNTVSLSPIETELEETIREETELEEIKSMLEPVSKEELSLPEEVSMPQEIETSQKLFQETVPVEQTSIYEKEEELQGIEKDPEVEFIDYSENPVHFTNERKFEGSVLEKVKERPVSANLKIESVPVAAGYVFPPINLLAAPSGTKTGSSASEIQATTERLRQTFESFKVRVNFGNVSCGPAVTRYEIQPEQGVKVSKITNLADDIKLNLAAADIRIEAPIPGKAAIGIEVPNRETSPVILRELLEDTAFKNHKSKIAFAVGKDVSGQPVVTDIAKMPHLLIAGATGSGKSVCINTLIMSILYKANPEDVKLIMVDPKVVELSVYNGIPHLLIPVVTDPKKASGALNWAVMEMTDRYSKFAALGVRDLTGYNKKIEEKEQKLPQIVIIVDELADLMMVAPGEVEDAICRLAQMARAAGLHLVIATQRPSVNVITGVIKANVPSRIAFSVSSAVDSRTIIDGVGAEKLLGKGDMLFFPSGLPKPIRVQGAFVSDSEVSSVVEFLREQNKTHSYDNKISEKITAASSLAAGSSESSEKDSYFAEAGKFIIEKEKASIGMLQRVYKIGFNRAARIMDQLAEAGVVGPEEGTKPRKILMTMEEFTQYLEESS